jgi:hypothetical protein
MNLFDARDVAGDDQPVELVIEILDLAAEHLRTNRLSREELARRRRRVEQAASAATPHEPDDGLRGPARIFTGPSAWLGSAEPGGSPDVDIDNEPWLGSSGQTLTLRRVRSSNGGVAPAVDVTRSTEKGHRIVGSERQSLAKDLVKRYTSGESIRALAESTGRSYGFIHRVLTESGVELRQRGGARRRKKA